jgi:uncharacterized repeat protein (TIGR01451 family)
MQNVVEGNFIGTDISGTMSLGNLTAGVDVEDATANTIGGTAAGAGNVIADNSGPGVEVTGATASGESILGNSIFGNTKLGIDLNDDGVTLNDSTGHSGPNDFQNFPVLTSAAVSSGKLTVQGALSSTPQTAYRVEFFLSPTADASGFGQGQTYLGFTTISTDSSGQAPFSAIFTSSAVNGQAVTATATDASGNTSEFSRAVTVGAPPPEPADVSVSISASSSSLAVGQELTYTVTARNSGPGSASQVILTDTLPGTVAYVSSSTGAFSVPAGGDVRVDLGTLNKGASSSITIVVRPTALAVGTITDSARVQNIEPDPVLSNNTATSSTTVVAPLFVQFGRPDFVAQETAGMATVEVERIGSTASAVSVNIATSGGTATAGKDYVAIAQTVTLAAGVSEVGVPITLVQDHLAQPNETIGLLLSNPGGGASLGALAGAQVTIVEDGGGTIDVTTNADSGPGSLRQAIAQANLVNGLQTIAFELPAGEQTIKPSSPLPLITASVFIKGYSQSGSLANTLATGDNAVLNVVLDGSLVPTATGLRIAGAGSVVRGLVIDHFQTGIDVTGDGVTIAGNFIGVDSGGATAAGNMTAGLTVESVGNTIGGTSPADRNIVSGNGTSGAFRSALGVLLERGGYNLVAGNYVGTDATGRMAIGNGEDGLSISDSPANTIGGTTSGAGNVIAGNPGEDMRLDGTSDGNLIAGNLIGTDVTGSTALSDGPSSSGLNIEGFGGSTPWDNTIGGTSAAARNIISGKEFNLDLSNGADNYVEGNFIGTDIHGTAPVGLEIVGIDVAAMACVIGGTAPGSGNLISGITGDSSNTGSGLELDGAVGTLVAGNLIGTDASGTNALGNRDGIRIATEVAGAGAAVNTIGGTTVAARNVISGNATGVAINEGPQFTIVPADSGPIRTVLQGNYIGTDVNGKNALGNSAGGVEIDNAADITVGGRAAGAGNVISGNDGPGVLINLFSDLLSASTGSGNAIVGNLIGTDATGQAALGNQGTGIEIVGADHDTIGGSATGAGNVIASNHGDGIAVLASPIGVQTGTQTTILGNSIGTDLSGVLPLGNAGSGVLLNSSNNTVGGTTAGASNVIAFNGHKGIVIAPGNNPGTGNTILGNSFYSNTGGLGIDLNDDGPTQNYAGSIPNGTFLPGANHLQGTPVVDHFSSSGGSTAVTGALHSIVSTTFTLQFYGAASSDPLEGGLFLGSTTVTTDGNGDATFSASLPVALPSGFGVTATATAPSGDTSEFSGPPQSGSTEVDLAVTALPHTGSIAHRGPQAASGGLAFDLQVANQSSRDANAVLLQFDLDEDQSQAVVSSVDAGSAAYSLVGNVLLVNFGSVTAGSTAKLTVNINNIKSLPTLTYGARVAGDEFDAVPRNNVIDGQLESNGTVTIVQEGYLGPPVVHVQDQPGTEGQELTVSAQVIDPSPHQNLQYSLGTRSASGGTIDQSGQFQFTPPVGPAKPKFTINVSDVENPAAPLVDFIAFQVTVANVVPVVSVGNDLNVPASGILDRDGSFTDPGQDTWTGTIDYGDHTTGTLTAGELGAKAFHLHHAYAAPGVYLVTLTISDNHDSGSASFHAAVQAPNAAPVLDSIIDREVNEGSTIDFAASAHDSDGDHLTYSLGQGAPPDAMIDSTTGEFRFTPRHGPASYRITVQVADDGTPTLSDAKPFTVTVDNVIPQVSAGVDITLPAGGTLDRAGSFVDPGQDIWTGTVDYGDGGGKVDLTIDQSAKTFRLNHTYAQARNYRVTIAISDGDPAGPGYVFSNVTVTGANGGPVVDPLGDHEVREGEPLSFVVIAHNSDGDLLSYSLDPLVPVGAAIDPNSGLFTFTPVHGGSSYEINVRVTDGANPAQSATRSFKVMVDDVRPVVAAGANIQIAAGASLDRAGSFFDPGTGGWTATVDYGDDGGPQPLALAVDKSFHLSHAYATAGSFTVKVSVTDSDAALGAASFSVQVIGPPVMISSVGVTTGSTKRGASGLTVNFSGVVAVGPGAFDLLDQRGRSMAVAASAVNNGSATTVLLRPVGRRKTIPDGRYTLVVHGALITDTWQRHLGGDVRRAFRLVHGRIL